MNFFGFTVAAVVIIAMLAVLLALWTMVRGATKQDIKLLCERLDLKRQSIEALKSRIDQVEARVLTCETEFKRPPTRHDLNNNLTTLVAAVHLMQGEMKGLKDQLGTNNDYLRAVIERDRG